MQQVTRPENPIMCVICNKEEADYCAPYGDSWANTCKGCFVDLPIADSKGYEYVEPAKKMLSSHDVAGIHQAMIKGDIETLKRILGEDATERLLNEDV